MRSYASLRMVFLDEREHFLHNQSASVATLRALFAFGPECRSRSRRNQCSPSPESAKKSQSVFRGFEVSRPIPHDVILHVTDLPMPVHVRNPSSFSRRKSSDFIKKYVLVQKIGTFATTSDRAQFQLGLH